MKSISLIQIQVTGHLCLFIVYLRFFYVTPLLCPLRPANLLLDRSSSEVPSMGTVGEWMDGMRTLPCKEAFSGVSYSSCDTLAKTSTE